ncbi:phage integrase SAM-like domain-containing protein [Mariniflexile maritimum]|uniref:phage integrase SAM-like domain-containing protein n=1 Tax=Mariniflexile maritimum TaxID=2682493 RepID=UPI0012F65EF3|nr:tyrosine-type recombinase/integrase [Mariniflexile maritimum]
MARVYFLYRSTKEKAALKVRLQLKSNREQFESNTQIHISKGAWKKKKGLTGDEKNEIASVNKKLAPLEDYILERFEQENPNPNQKAWLKDIVNDFYNNSKKTELPIYLVDFIEYYIESKKTNNEIKESQIKRITTTKNKIIRIQNEYNTILRVKDIDEDFKTNYIKFSNKYSYAVNTQNKELERIKTICRYANKKGIEISDSLNDLKIKTEKSPKTYLTLEEIEKIKNVELKHSYLENARNWLLISIYTGQRISDFMRFKKEMIITDENKKTFIKFDQIKTGKSMYVPVSKELKTLLKSLKNNFPKPISDQKYNDYIKEVCKEAKINTMCEGKKRISIAEEGKKPTKYDFRDISGNFPKWELVSSHIGRRTFATNNYGKIPTPYLIYITGHGTEKEFLNYIVLPDYEKAKQAFDHFN